MFSTVDCCIQCIHSSFGVISSSMVEKAGQLLYIRVFSVASPTVISTIYRMISGGLHGSLGFVFLSIFTCFADGDDAPFISQKHACCCVVNHDEIMHPEPSSSAPNGRQCHSESYCKRRYHCSNHPSRSHCRRSGHPRRKIRRQSLRARDGKGL